MTTISKDALSRPYAFVDFSVFEPVAFAIPPALLEKLTKDLAAVADTATHQHVPPNKLSDKNDEETLPVWYKRRINLILSQHKYVEITDATKTTLSTLIDRFNFESRQPTVNLCTLGLTALDMLECESEPSVKKEDEQHILNAWESLKSAYSAQYLKTTRLPQPKESLFFPPISPLGMLHSYRQHFIYKEVNAGPLEIVQALAPNEKMEVVIEESRSRSFEQTLETSVETQSNTSTETKDTEELSDSFSKAISRNSTSNISANGGVNFVVWNAGGSASHTVSDTATETALKTSKNVHEVTKKQSDQIKQSTKLTTRSLEQISSRTSTRHIIENKSDAPINYGLRRLYYEVSSKLQDLCPSLVWQSMVVSPGNYLALAKLIDIYPEEKPIFLQESIREFKIIDARSVEHDNTNYFQINLEYCSLFSGLNEPEIDAALLTIECTMLNLKALRTTTYKPYGFRRKTRYIYEYWLICDINNLSAFDADFLFKVKVNVPNVNVIKQFDKMYDDNHIGAKKFVAAVQGLAIKRDRYKGGLAEEERAILVAQVLEPIWKYFDSKQVKLPEFFTTVNRVFDLEKLFYDLSRPEWHQTNRIHKAQPNSLTDLTYGIISTVEQPVTLGASLDWKRQIDADDQRNRFINAENATVCIPVRPGFEKDAIAILENALPDAPISATDPGTKNLIKQFECIRKAQAKVQHEAATESSIAVTIKSKNKTPPRPWLKACAESENIDLLKELHWADVYPIISNQYVVVPVQGYVHEEIKFEAYTTGSPEWSDSGKSEETQKRKKPWYCYPWF